MNESTITSRHRPFNAPLETGLRTLFILNEVYPMFHDLQRLVYYDYLLVYSGDVPDAPLSLHPHIPHRGGGWLVRRKILEDGLFLMFSKELIAKQFSDKGILYGASEITRPFLNLLTSPYSSSLRRSAQWVATTFESYAEARLSEFMQGNLGRWGAEFDRESVIRGNIQ